MYDSCPLVSFNNWMMFFKEVRFSDARDNENCFINTMKNCSEEVKSIRVQCSCDVK